MLRYTDKTRFIIGVPARDLTDAEIKALGLIEEELIRSGLYQKEIESPDVIPKIIRRRR